MVFPFFLDSFLFLFYFFDGKIETNSTFIRRYFCLKQLKKYMIASFLFMLSFGLFSPNVHAEDDLRTLLNGQQLVAEENLPTTSLVIEATNGQILWEDNTNQTIDPGYLTHLMTLYLTYDALHKEEITWQSTITANETHQALSQLQYLPNNTIFAGATYTLEDLIKLVSFPTSTAASYLLAELITPNLDDFVIKMNETAQQLGLKQTTFYSPSGLTPTSLQENPALIDLTPQQANQSTAKDLALLTFHFVNKFPEVFDITKQTEVVVQGSLITQESFTNRNPFLFGQPNAIKGANGLLMDYSNLQHTSGLFTVTQGDMTVISLLMGANDTFTMENQLSPMTIAGEALLNHVFEQYEYRVLAEKGEQTLNRTTFYLENDFGTVLPKTADATLELKEGRLYLTNNLPLISDSLPEIAVPYSKNSSKIEEKVKNNSFLNSIIQFFEITQLTILALGTMMIGFLFFLMSFFIPKSSPQKNNQIANELDENDLDLETFEAVPLVSEHQAPTDEEMLEEAIEPSDESEPVIEMSETLEEEAQPTRSERHQTNEITTSRWPFHQITFYGGLVLVAIGVISLIVQSFI